MVIAILHGQPGRAVGCPAERPQQAELVSRALRIGEDQVAQQRQRTGAVIEQAQHDARPGHARPALAVGGFELDMRTCINSPRLTRNNDS